MSSKRRNIVVAAVVGVVVAGGVVAVAATQFGSTSVKVTGSAPVLRPSTRAGGFRGTPGSGGLDGPGLGGGFRGGFGAGGGFGGGFRGGFFGGLAVAATYLGVSETALQNDLASGKTLAQVAKAQGKTADGLVDAMVTATRKRLDTAVSSGRFTKAQEATIVANLQARYKALVSGTLPAGGFGRGFGGDFAPGGGGLGGGSGSFGSGAAPA
jgi:hypothetical protein